MRELQSLKKHLAELLGRVDVERPARLFIDVLFERFELRLHLTAKRRKGVRIDAHARVLHAREHGAEGQFYVIIELVQPALLERGGKGLIQRIDSAGVDMERRLGFGCVAEHREGLWLQVLRLGERPVKVGGEKRRNVVLARRRVEQIPCERRVENEAVNGKIVFEQRALEVLDVVADLFDIV